MVQVTDYPGYNIIGGIPTYFECSEYKYNPWEAQYVLLNQAEYPLPLRYRRQNHD